MARLVQHPDRDRAADRADRLGRVHLRDAHLDPDRQHLAVYADSGRRAGVDAGLTDSRRAASGPPFAQSRTTISAPTRTTRSHGIAGWPCTFACPAPPVPPVPTP